MVNPLGGTSGTDPYYGDNATNGVGGSQKVDTPPVDPEILLELQKFFNALEDLTNSNGAPTLASPDRLAFGAADDMLIAIAAFASLNKEQQLKVVMTALNQAGKDLDQKYAEIQKNIQKWINDTIAASKKSSSGGVFGWIKRIVAFVAPVVMLAIAAVTFNPALAVVGALMLAGAIMQEAGFSLSKAVNDLAAKFLEKCGVPHDAAQKWGKLLIVAVMVAQPAFLALMISDPSFGGTILQGCAEVCGANQQEAMIANMVGTVITGILVAIATAPLMGGAGAFNTLSDTSRTIQMAATIIDVGSQVIGGAADVGKGAIDIQVGKLEADAMRANAAKEQNTALVLAFQKALEDEQQIYAQIIKSLEALFSKVSEMLASLNDGREKITSNLSGSTV